MTYSLISDTRDRHFQNQVLRQVMCYFAELFVQTLLGILKPHCRHFDFNKDKYDTAATTANIAICFDPKNLNS